MIRGTDHILSTTVSGFVFATFDISYLKTILKRNLPLICLAISLASCSSLKPSAAKKPASATSKKQADSPPVFIENISISVNSSSELSSKEQPAVPEARGISTAENNTVERLNELQFKYAILLDAPVEEMVDYKLMEFIEGWYGTPYKLGGADKSGVDCSAFVQAFMASIFDKSLPRTALEQYKYGERIPKNELKEGDLVFFRTQRKGKISHVGVYLRNNKFVHASTSSGVMISDLDEPYFSGKFAGAGRVILPEHNGSSN